MIPASAAAGHVPDGAVAHLRAEVVPRLLVVDCAGCGRSHTLPVAALDSGQWVPQPCRRAWLSVRSQVPEGNPRGSIGYGA